MNRWVVREAEWPRQRCARRGRVGLEPVPILGAIYCFFLVIVLNACVPAAGGPVRSSSGKWLIGVLRGYELFWVDPGSSALSKPINLRTTWDRSIFFTSPRQVEKQPGEYPAIRIIAGSPRRGDFLANLGGIAYREAGPLVLSNIRTGRVLRTYAVSDSEAVAAFLPPDDRRLVISGNDPAGSDETKRLWVYDVASDHPIVTLPLRAPGAFGLRFSPDNSKLLALEEPPSGQGSFRFVTTSSWSPGEQLVLPAGGSYSVLDFRGGSLLLESWPSDRLTSCWHIGTSSTAVRELARESYSEPPHFANFFLARSGERVVRWEPGSGILRILSCDQGQAPKQVTVGKPIQQYALHPTDNSVAFIAGDDLVIVDIETGQISARLTRILRSSTSGENSLFWFAAE